MFYAFVIGAILGWSNVAVVTALLMQAGLVGWGAVLSIVFKRNLITDSPSTYALFAEKLVKKGEFAKGAWVSYLVQSLVFGCLIGAVAFCLGRGAALLLNNTEAWPMTWLWWASPLLMVVFLWTLSESLRGRLKEVISGVLAILIFALVATAFVVSGWKAGIGALVGAFALVNLLRPLALAIARRLIKYPDLGFDGYGRRKFERMIADFGSEAWFKRQEREEEKEARHKNETVSTAMKNPAIAETLARLGGTERDLAALYDRFEVLSLPPRIRKTVLENARLVAFFLENSESYEIYDGSYARKVSENTAIRLQLWTHSNPGGREPGT